MTLPVQIVSTGASTCEVHQYNMTALVVKFPVPLADTALVALLKSLVSDPDKDSATSGGVLVTRMRDGMTVKVGDGSFFIRHPFLFPLVVA